ncbi:MAG: photosynthetic reaction center cytochrome PufC [Beijerinckiaceae bacterium]|jgi:photosynthetic reaction center cytochrome c subunit|nr:photosynthetic reaction center cytochrome PufC [Beijerinckiaceae bacterium]
MSTQINSSIRFGAIAAAALGFGMLLAGCQQNPPEATQQNGYRGVALEQVQSPKLLAKLAEANQAPEVVPPGDRTGPRASQVYQNVKVLGDLSETEFTRIMVAMTGWVAPGGVAGSDEGQGCSYCHNLNNMADESKYQYQTARRMIQMTREINSNWTNHVGATGVSCYTCHRGNPIPAQTWFTGGGHPKNLADGGGWLGANNGQNLAGKHVGRASLPADPFTPLIQFAETIRVTGKTALPTAKGETIAVAERTNALMNHMSESLGVNCTFCHNSRAFAEWKDAPPQRVNAFHGIRMLREINANYLAPLNTTYPATKLGPEGDAAKAYCATCHQGAQKPVNGAPMLGEYPELGAPRN